jgi:hypothetical protein
MLTNERSLGDLGGAAAPRPRKSTSTASLIPKREGGSPAALALLAPPVPRLLRRARRNPTPAERITSTRARLPRKRGAQGRHLRLAPQPEVARGERGDIGDPGRLHSSTFGMSFLGAFRKRRRVTKSARREEPEPAAVEADIAAGRCTATAPCNAAVEKRSLSSRYRSFHMELRQANRSAKLSWRARFALLEPEAIAIAWFRPGSPRDDCKQTAF